jgi:hypothetical protein
LDRFKHQKKKFFEFFSSISWGLCTGTKREKLNFYSSNILNSPLVPALNPKSTTFSPLVQVQSPQEIQENNSKKVFFGYLYRSKYIIFGHKKLLKNCSTAFGTCYYLQNFFLKTKVVHVPNTGSSGIYKLNYWLVMKFLTLYNFYLFVSMGICGCNYKVQ